VSLLFSSLEHPQKSNRKKKNKYLALVQFNKGANMFLRKKLEFFVFLMAIVGYFLPVHSNTNQFQDTLDDIFHHAQTSIDRIEEGKVFFHPEKIHICDGKLYIEAKTGKLIAIPGIFSSDSGLFLQLDNQKTSQIWICKKCTWRHYYEPQECERCDGRVFIIRYQ